MRKHGDIKVFMSNRDNKCEDCGREIEQGEFIQLYSNKVYCLTCADLDHLVFLSSGDTVPAANTRAICSGRMAPPAAKSGKNGDECSPAQAGRYARKHRRFFARQVEGRTRPQVSGPYFPRQRSMRPEARAVRYPSSPTHRCS